MAGFMFNLKHKEEINLLMLRLGVSKEEASDFLYKYHERKTNFKEYFKSYLKEWLPDGSDSEGRLNTVWTFSFPKRTVDLHLLGGKKDMNWHYLLH